jgi:heme/copper-type cytochrome/quinol oxidase subunit 4
MDTGEIVTLIWPLIVIQLGLMVVALLDLRKRETVKGNSKALWAVLIIVLNIIGPVLYLMWGRER